MTAGCARRRGASRTCWDEISGSSWRGYVYLGGQLLALQHGSAVHWVHQDPVVKSQRVTQANGSVSTGVELDPWGGDTNRSWNQSQQPQRYTSYLRDGNESDEAQMRRYNRWWSRFDQPDPYDGSYNLGDPQSFNRYAYVQNDPVNFVDPTGLNAQAPGGTITCVRVLDDDGNVESISCRDWGTGQPVDNSVYVGADVGFDSGNSRGPLWMDIGDVIGGGGRRVQQSPADTNDAAINKLISTCGIGASIGQYNNVSMDGTMFRGLNSKWYPMAGRGPNQYTGARSLATGKSSAFGKLGRVVGVGGMGLSAIQGYQGYQQEGVSGAAKPTLDFAMGAVGTFGGPPGAVVGGTYFAVDLTVGWSNVGRAVANDPRDPCNGRARQMLTNRLGPPR